MSGIDCIGDGDGFGFPLGLIIFLAVIYSGDELRVFWVINPGFFRNPGIL
jgi:hypothetical protein